MSLNVISRSATCSIELPKTFNYSNHKDFKLAYSRLLEDPAVREVEVDFRLTSYIDSAALGMLLMLRSCAEAAGKSVVLVNASGTVRDILEIAHFETLFTFK
jgi:HptB-dependent secretion and biofilm anti anti-sigma factor